MTPRQCITGSRLVLTALEFLLEGAEDMAEGAEEQSSDSLELDLDLDRLDAEDGDKMDDATRELDLNDIEKILEMEGAGESWNGSRPGTSKEKRLPTLACSQSIQAQHRKVGVDPGPARLSPGGESRWVPSSTP